MFFIGECLLKGGTLYKHTHHSSSFGFLLWHQSSNYDDNDDKPAFMVIQTFVGNVIKSLSLMVLVTAEWSFGVLQEKDVLRRKSHGDESLRSRSIRVIIFLVIRPPGPGLSLSRNFWQFCNFISKFIINLFPSNSD